jgi:hypothetical protein
MYQIHHTFHHYRCSTVWCLCFRLPVCTYTRTLPNSVNRSKPPPPPSKQHSRSENQILAWYTCLPGWNTALLQVRLERCECLTNAPDYPAKFYLPRNFLSFLLLMMSEIIYDVLSLTNNKGRLEMFTRLVYMN